MTVWRPIIRKSADTSWLLCRDGFLLRRLRPYGRYSRRTRLCCACHSLSRLWSRLGATIHTISQFLFTTHSNGQRVVLSLRESLGISADGSEKAFGTEAIASMIKRVPNRIQYNVREPASNVNHVFVAVDPSGGGASAFSIASIIQEASGFLQARVQPHSFHYHCPYPPSTCL